MIDIHNHILPGIDDGPEGLDQSMEMCRMAAQDGITTIVATPHSFNGQFLNSPTKIKALVRLLNERIRAERLDLQILPGMETRIHWELTELLAMGKVLTLNEGRYLLLEFHPSQLPAGFENLVERLVSIGNAVILAHPEKNFEVQQKPAYLKQLIAHFQAWDVLVQISADSVIGTADRAAVKAARTLMNEDVAHIIASDAHSVKHRPPRLSEAVISASRVVGRVRARQMVEDIPNAVLTGLGFPRQEQPTRRSLWRRLLTGRY
jgi:protein-tyrosine phosphatase